MADAGKAAMFVVLLVAPSATFGDEKRSVDLSHFRAECGVSVEMADERLLVRWPLTDGQQGEMSFRLRPSDALIESMRVIGPDGAGVDVLRDLDPCTVVTVGARDLSKRNGWTIFFDKTHTRPSQSHRLSLDSRNVVVRSHGQRCRVEFHGVSGGGFEGDLIFTFVPQCNMIQSECVVSTQENARAILYHSGLTCESESLKNICWLDSQDKFHRVDLTHSPANEARNLAVRYRTVLAESDHGCVAVFPPPHQYLYPLDFADNLKLTWYGRGFMGLSDRLGFGVRHDLNGDNRFVPWFNAPPGTEQRLGVFYLLSGEPAEATLEKVKAYTHGDRFIPLPGHKTFTSHYHVEHIQVLERQRRERQTDGIPADLVDPGFVQTFKRTGINIAHLAEFHLGVNMRAMPAQDRLPWLAKMFSECERLSADDFLLLPGEEANVHLGGHWMCLFPKPVYWVLNRSTVEPFLQQDVFYGRVYHVGSPEDVWRVMQEENGLMWTAHARIKSSTGYPDRYRDNEFYQSDQFLGAAWKAMPADLSRDRLGWRVLDLMDDMANWGQKKYVLGEVDVFEVHPDSELYGHANINYLKLDEVPRFEDGWQSVLDVLREGRFFVTTGEIVIPEFDVSGTETGGTLPASRAAAAEVRASLQWTFPLAFAEVISGDGKSVWRERFDLSETTAFGERDFTLPVNLDGRRWVRFEVWDIAKNGAFTQPVGIASTESLR